MAFRFEKIASESAAWIIASSFLVTRAETYSTRALVLGQKDGYKSHSNVPLVRSCGGHNIATKVNRSYRQAIGNNGCWRQ